EVGVRGVLGPGEGRGSGRGYGRADRRMRHVMPGVGVRLRRLMVRMASVRIGLRYAMASMRIRLSGRMGSMRVILRRLVTCVRIVGRRGGSAMFRMGIGLLA